MRRYHAILGTKTTAGGEVITAGSTRTMNGVPFALEGDRVRCPACKSEGVIRCQGPRLIDTWNGVNIALEHDLCICRCSTPPTLLAGQKFSSQNVDADGFAFDGGSSGVMTAPAAADVDVDEVIVSQHFELTDGEGRPVEGYRYDIYKDGILHIRNASLTAGKTAVVEGDAELKLVMWTPDSAARA